MTDDAVYPNESEVAKVEEHDNTTLPESCSQQPVNEYSACRLKGQHQMAAVAYGAVNCPHILLISKGHNGRHLLGRPFSSRNTQGSLTFTAYVGAEQQYIPVPFATLAPTRRRAETLTLIEWTRCNNETQKLQTLIYYTEEEDALGAELLSSSEI